MEDEEKEAWRKHADDMEKMRQRRRWQFRQAAKELRDLGFEIKEVSQFQYRINEAIDIFPSNKRYHDLTKNIRGDIRGQSFANFIRSYFGIISKV